MPKLNYDTSDPRSYGEVLPFPGNPVNSCDVEEGDNLTQFEIEEKFKEAAATQCGLRIRTITPGEIGRCPTNDRPRRKNGAFRLWLDGVIPAGWFSTSGRMRSPSYGPCGPSRN